MKLTLLYFSPTRTTKKIVAAVGKVFFERMLCETKLIDLTPLAARMRSYSFSEEDVVVFGAPVYGGRLPALLLPVLEKAEGNGARAVVLSVYGNRDYDSALAESCDLLSARGFCVCAAGAFIGEHSYTSAVGRGRPDAEDLLAAQTFGVVAWDNVSARKVLPSGACGKKPYKEYSPFLLSPKQMPAADADKCTKCGKCIAVCPVCNIGADLSDLGRCIACAACVKSCPEHARSFGAQIAATAEKLEKMCAERHQPKFFV